MLVHWYTNQNATLDPSSMLLAELGWEAKFQKSSLLVLAKDQVHTPKKTKKSLGWVKPCLSNTPVTPHTQAIQNMGPPSTIPGSHTKMQLNCEKMGHHRQTPGPAGFNSTSRINSPKSSKLDISLRISVYGCVWYVLRYNTVQVIK